MCVDRWLVGWLGTFCRQTPTRRHLRIFCCYSTARPATKVGVVEQRFVNLKNTQFSKYTNNFFKAIPNKFLRGCKRLINFLRNWCRPQNFRFSHREGDSVAKTRTHTNVCGHPHAQAHSLLELFTRLTQVDRAQPTHSQLRHELSRYPFARHVQQRCSGFVPLPSCFVRVTSDDSWRSHALFATVVVASLSVWFDCNNNSRERRRRGEQQWSRPRTIRLHLAEGVSVALLNDATLCACVCVCCVVRESDRERDRALSAKLTTDYPVAAYWSPLCCCRSADTCSVCWHKLFAIHPRSVLPDCCNCGNIFRMPLWRWNVEFK